MKYFKLLKGQSDISLEFKLTIMLTFFFSYRTYFPFENLQKLAENIIISFDKSMISEVVTKILNFFCEKFQNKIADKYSPSKIHFLII